jgi:hypothetical protein
MSSFILPPFSKNTSNKIGNGIEVSGKNTLIKTNDYIWRIAIADEPIAAKVDGKKMFCVRVDNAGTESRMMIGFTPMETFDSTKGACFGNNGFIGCGLRLHFGDLCYPVSKHHDIINWEITKKAKEVIAILTISNNGKKKEIQFLCDGKESKSSDVSNCLKGDRLFPAICICNQNQQITTIPIDQIKTRTPEIDELIKEYQQQPKHNNMEEVKQARNDLLKQNEEMMSNFFNQFEQQTNVSDAVEVEVETKKENTKEKKAKQVATKKTKKETKSKTMKATKKKEEK